MRDRERVRLRKTIREKTTRGKDRYIHVDRLRETEGEREKRKN